MALARHAEDWRGGWGLLRDAVPARCLRTLKACIDGVRFELLGLQSFSVRHDTNVKRGAQFASTAKAGAQAEERSARPHVIAVDRKGRRAT